MRPIDADAVFERAGCKPGEADIIALGREFCNAPILEVMPVTHSSWSVFAEMDLREGRTGKHILLCRECGHTEKIHHSDKMPNYCSNCGAKMDGGKDDADN